MGLYFNTLNASAMALNGSPDGVGTLMAESFQHASKTLKAIDTQVIASDFAASTVKSMEVQNAESGRFFTALLADNKANDRNGGMGGIG